MSLACKIEKATRSSDHYIDALVKSIELWFKSPTTIESKYTNVSDTTGNQEIFSDLDAEFASRNHDKGLRLAGCAFALGEHAINDGNAKSEGLTGTGLRLADEVIAA